MKPRLLTREGRARAALKAWQEQYKNYSRSDILEITRALEAAAESPSYNADLVDSIIGNGSWTELRCDSCYASKLHVAVEVGQRPDFDSNTATLCESCLNEALALCRSAKDESDR